MYNKLIGYGQTGHDNMWDSIGQGMEGNGKGKVVFLYKDQRAQGVYGYPRKASGIRVSGRN